MITKVKIPLSIDPALLGQVSSRGAKRSTIISRDLGRLYDLYQTELLKFNFIEAEAKVLCLFLHDCCGDPALIGYYIPEEEKDLRRKLLAITTLQGLAVLDAVERYRVSQDLKKSFLLR